jgi:hypothetical protein
MILPSGVLRNSVPSTRIGVASKERAPGTVSPVRNVHAVVSVATLLRFTCVSEEKRVPPGSPP